MAKMIVINEQRCLGCKTCVLQCAMAHSEAKSLAEAVASAAPPQPRVHVEAAGTCGIPLQCRHCQDAPCMTVCPTEAIHRPVENGPVLIESAKCIGCKFCLQVCPFGVIDLSRDGKAMVKCDLCLQLTQEGEEPACVAGCPTGALEFCEVDEWLKRRRQEAAAKIAAGEDAARLAMERNRGR
ncbi:MAG: 4Fe-4S dicluster domain-containing protein [Phycisphaerae bacterium]|jgi:carbon-monoxide dehydrogenase iron sulfur subunit